MNAHQPGAAVICRQHQWVRTKKRGVVCAKCQKPFGEQRGLMPASPHQVGHHPGLHGEDIPYTTGDQPKRRNAHASDVGMNRPTRSRYEALTLDELLESDDNEYEPPRLPTSSIRLQPGEYVQGRTKMHVHQGPPPVQKRQSQKREEQTARDQAKAEGRQEQAKHHSLVIFVLSMLATLVLLVLGGSRWALYTPSQMISPTAIREPSNVMPW